MPQIEAQTENQPSAAIVSQVQTSTVQAETITVDVPKVPEQPIDVVLDQDKEEKPEDTKTK